MTIPEPLLWPLGCLCALGAVHALDYLATLTERAMRWGKTWE